MTREKASPSPHSEAFEQARKARSRLIDRLEREGRQDLADRLLKCAETMGMTCTGCGAQRTVETRCKLRWCPVCQRKIAAQASMRYERILALAKFPLVVTWTCENWRGTDVNFLRSLRKAHARMRRLRWWKRCVVGGVVCSEVTNKGKGWHAHLHGLLDCRWLGVRGMPAKLNDRSIQANCEELAEQWSLCLERPGSIYVSRAWRGKDGSSPVQEIVKYSCKVGELLKLRAPIGPIIDMWTGTNTLSSFGSFRGHPHLKREEAPPTMCPCGCTKSYIPDFVADSMMRPKRRTHN